MLQEPTGLNFPELKVNLTNENNRKVLQGTDLENHLTSLQSMVHFLSLNLERNGKKSPVVEYMYRLEKTLCLVNLRHRILEGQDLIDNCLAIDPTESGYPFYFEELMMLHEEKKEIGNRLKSLPTLEKLVPDALYYVDRATFPESIVQ